MKYLYLLLLLATSLHAKAQSQYRTSLQDYYLANSIEGSLFLERLSMGGGLHFIPGTADLHFTGFADSIYRDTTFKRNTRATESYVFYIGSYIPIVLVSDNSMLVAEIEFMGSVSKLIYDSIAFSAKTKILAPATTVKFGMPVSLEYRNGADVLLNKNVKSMFSIGAGFNICGINSSDYNKVKPIKLQPFIKAELGFMFGIAFKFRGVYTFGRSVYDYASAYNVAGGHGDQLISEFRGSNGFNISLILMPFSLAWTR